MVELYFYAIKDDVFLLLFFRMDSFRGKLTRQQIMSLGGSVSLPLGLRTPCILSNSMGESGGLSNRSLNIMEAVCSRNLV